MDLTAADYEAVAAPPAHVLRILDAAAVIADPLSGQRELHLVADLQHTEAGHRYRQLFIFPSPAVATALAEELANHVTYFDHPPDR